MENYLKQQERRRLESRLNIYSKLVVPSLAVCTIGFITMITSPIYLIPERSPKGYIVYKRAENTLEYLKLKKENLNERKANESSISYENLKIIESLNKLDKIENDLLFGLKSKVSNEG